MQARASRLMLVPLLEKPIPGGCQVHCCAVRLCALVYFFAFLGHRGQKGASSSWVDYFCRLSAPHLEEEGAFFRSLFF